MTGATTPPKPLNPFPDALWDEIKHEDLENYLAATPFCTSGSLGDQLHDDFFFDKLYIDSKDSQATITRIKDAHLNPDLSGSHPILVAGDRGCGKTTLIRKAFQLKEHERAKQETPWNRRAHCYIIDFENTIRGNLAEEGIDGLDYDERPTFAKQVLRSFVVNTLLDATLGEDPPIMTLFRYFDPKDPTRASLLGELTPDGELGRFFRKLRDKVPQENADAGLPTHDQLARRLKHWDFAPLVYLGFFAIISAAIMRAPIDDTYILFDNIDRIGSETVAQDLASTITTLSDGLIAFMKRYEISAPAYETVKSILRHIRVIIAMRKTTLNIVSTQHQELVSWLESPQTMEQFYEMDRVLALRLDLYTQACDSEDDPSDTFSRNAQRARDAADLVRLPALSQELPKLFNGNERVLAYVLALSTKSHTVALHTAADLIRQIKLPGDPSDSNTDTLTFTSKLSATDRDRLAIARGWLIRAFIDQLAIHGHLAPNHVPRLMPQITLRQSALHEDMPPLRIPIPLPIMVLLYLHNIREGSADLPAIFSEGKVTLDQILSDFAPLFQEPHIGLSTLADVLWRLYWRQSRDSRVWARLVRIDGLGAKGAHRLQAAVKEFVSAPGFPAAREEIETDLNPSIHISAAGSALLELIYTQYEFGAWMAAPNACVPLAQQIATDNFTKIAESIRAAIASLTRLSSSLARSFDHCIGQDAFDTFGRPRVESLPFVFCTLGYQRGILQPRWQYYTEQMAYSYLSYIESARHLLCTQMTTEDQLAQVSGKLSAQELRILELFKGGNTDGTLHMRTERLKRLKLQQDLLTKMKDEPLASWKHTPFEISE